MVPNTTHSRSYPVDHHKAYGKEREGKSKEYGWHLKEREIEGRREAYVTPKTAKRMLVGIIVLPGMTSLFIREALPTLTV